MLRRGKCTWEMAAMPWLSWRTSPRSCIEDVRLFVNPRHWLTWLCSVVCIAVYNKCVVLLSKWVTLNAAPCTYVKVLSIVVFFNLNLTFYIYIYIYIFLFLKKKFCIMKYVLFAFFIFSCKSIWWLLSSLSITRRYLQFSNLSKSLLTELKPILQVYCVEWMQCRKYSLQVYCAECMQCRKYSSRNYRVESQWQVSETCCQVAGIHKFSQNLNLSVNSKC